jgi:hypothetical protein
MRKYALCLLCLLGIVNAHAQSATDSVKTCIDGLFRAMKDADSSALLNCFAPGAILQTIKNNQGSTTVKTEAVQEFAAAIGKLAKGAADERIRYDVVKTDDQLAVAWTPYRFYYQGKFSHCGVNAFQLVRLQGGWKIQYIIDTRRKTGCVE